MIYLILFHRHFWDCKLHFKAIDWIGRDWLRVLQIGSVLSLAVRVFQGGMKKLTGKYIRTNFNLWFILWWLFFHHWCNSIWTGCAGGSQHCCQRCILTAVVSRGRSEEVLSETNIAAPSSVQDDLGILTWPSETYIFGFRKWCVL